MPQPASDSEQAAANRPSPRQRVVVDDLEGLLQALPPHIRNELAREGDLQGLLEVVTDLGRVPQARFRDQERDLGSQETSTEDMDYVVSRIGAFGEDNRAGIERTLHRISCIRNRKGRVVGLTLRVGRAVFGTIDIIDDLVFSGKSILLLGRPGVGKTTMLREVARILADSAHKRVVVVDTSNEIAGDGDIPHSGIGRARRMQVKSPVLQHDVMIEAVENHMPQVIVIDEMGTELEAAAARTIAERGVQLIATAHGNTLENLILNPTLADLVGGIQPVTLSDEEARRRGTQKTVLERKSPPTFTILVEIQTWDRVVVYDDVAAAVDRLLRGFAVIPEVREVDEDGGVRKTEGEPVVLESAVGTGLDDLGPFPPERRTWRRRGPEPSRPGREPLSGVRARAEAAELAAPPPAPSGKTVRVYPFGVARDRLFQGVRAAGGVLEVVETPQQADIILTTKTHYRRKSEVLKNAEQAGKSIYVLRRNSESQVEQFARSLSPSNIDGTQRVMNEGLADAETAAMQVMGGAASVELAPQDAYIRRLQHQLAERYNLASASTGREPYRRVIIYKP
ncbi:MAG: AAA family ATPase [Dehalococcoidia bacterium]|nr:AAA family ATPase [Dehalococcoidia bacterium]